MTCGGVLLTGGASRRMATDKARIVWRGETLAARAARVLTSVCDPVVEVGPGVSDLRCVREEPVGAGPLTALVAGARSLPDGAPLILLACDLPFVDSSILRVLADWPDGRTVIPRAGGRLQYACARYGPDALTRAAAAVHAGERALRVLASFEHDEIDEDVWRVRAPAETFSDVDTPEDLIRLGLS